MSGVFAALLGLLAMVGCVMAPREMEWDSATVVVASFMTTLAFFVTMHTGTQASCSRVQSPRAPGYFFSERWSKDSLTDAVTRVVYLSVDSVGAVVFAAVTLELCVGIMAVGALSPITVTVATMMASR